MKSRVSSFSRLFLSLPLMVVLSAFGTACGRPGSKNAKGQEWLSPPTGTVMGQTRAVDVTRRLGPPSAQQGSRAVKGVTYLEYRGRADRLRLQTRGGLVEAEFRDPPVGSPQSTLQYWRHRWKGERTRYEVVPGTGSAHEKPSMQFSAPELGAAVVYDPIADRVTRVVRYAP